MKKNQIFSMMLAAAVAFGAASCDKTTEGAGDVSTGGTGELAINFAFNEQEATRATTKSTAKPTTTWKDNIKSVAIFCAQGGTVKYAQSITNINFGAAGQDNGSAQQCILTGVPASTTPYDVYVFANWDQGDRSVTNALDVTTAKGRRVVDLYMEALSAAQDAEGYKAPSEADTKFYKEAPEIFVAKQSNITVVKDQQVTVPNAFALTRIVGLVRVRINPHDQAAKDHIDFKHANASVRIRRINTGSNLDKTTRTLGATPEKTTFFSKGAFKHEEPTLADNYDVTAGKKILTDDFKYWKDMILFPGGTAGTGNKFDLVITGITKDGQYVPAGRPSNKPAGQGSQIAWIGGVTGELTANNILELNCKIVSAGNLVVDPTDPDAGGDLPGAEDYGKLQITVNLVDWGNITSVDMEM